MTGAERGFLLLTSRLGNPERKPLTVAQLRTLEQRVRGSTFPVQERELEQADLLRLGYSEEMARRILALLSEEELLDYYLQKARREDCAPLTRKTPGYPRRVHRLDPDAPGCLWYKGDPALLERPAVALVGSRELAPANREFAREAGRQAALQGYVLVSGNARGADQEAQAAALAAGGWVISVVADNLSAHSRRERVLLLSEDGYDLPFSPIRALSRNRVIHALGQCTLVAQSSLGTGGTWDGSVRNLKHRWSPLCCFSDGSEAAEQLCGMGAVPVILSDLCNLTELTREEPCLF